LTDESPREPDQVKELKRPDGSRLHVECYGENHGPTLLFTHGWSLDRTAWTYARDALAGKYRVVVWDLPGLGRSQGPTNGDYSLEKMAADLEAVVQVAGKGPIILVGHSIGGMLIQTYCRLFPKQLGTRIGAIIFVTTTYTNPLRTALGAPLWRAIERPVLVPLNHLTVWLAPLAWLSNWQSYMNGSMHLVTRIASFAGKQTWRQVHYGAWLAAKAWPAVVARGNLAMLKFDEQKQLPQIEIPVLVIAGSHDRMTKPQASDRLEELIPHARQIRIEAGHLGLWEHQRELVQLIEEFVDLQSREQTASRRDATAPRTA
jgi:pimeloyl-ACP methyl ester carboxylesterase